MAALTEDNYDIADVLGASEQYAVGASTTIYKGALVATNAAGFLVPGADAAGLVFAGMANQKVDNSAGANGDKTCMVTLRSALKRIKVKAATTPTQAWVGADVFLADDQSVDLAGALTSDIRVGVVTSFSGSEVVVDVSI